MNDLSNENVIQIEKNGVKYLQFKKLLEYEDIIKHAYSLGVDTNYRTAKPDKQKLPKDKYEKAIEDYKKLFSKLYDNLNFGGSLCFTTFGKDNFRQIKDITGLGLNYPNLDEFIKKADIALT